MLLVTVSQSSVFAQNSTSTLNSAPITPAPETSGNNDDSSSIDNYVQKLINDATEESTSGATEESTSNDIQKDAISSKEDIDETKDAKAKTNPLSEQIKENVTGHLNAAGIAVP